MARNLRRTYLRPFVIVTANMGEAAAQRGWGTPRAHLQCCPPWPRVGEESTQGGSWWSTGLSDLGVGLPREAGSRIWP